MSEQQQQKGLKDFFTLLFSPITATLDFFQNYFKAIILVLVLLFLASLAPKGVIAQPNLMSIHLRGTILEAKDILEEIQKAQKPNIKGVLFVVDSPGGAVAPSLEISRAIKRLREKKPVVAYAAGTMASGSYYATIWANKIVANPGSIVGSIGVIFEGPNLKGLLDKIGIAPQVVKAGKYKEVGTPFRAWKPYEKKEMQKVIEDTYHMFVSDVAHARKLDINNSDSWANAHIFTAKQAKKVGLIDKVATHYEAKKLVEKLSGVKKPIWQKEDKFEKLMRQLSNQTASKLASLLFGLLH